MPREDPQKLSLMKISADKDDDKNESSKEVLICSDVVPSYMKTCNKSFRPTYAKMTENDWLKLMENEELEKQGKSKRSSSVQFTDSNLRGTNGSFKRSSQRSSILKRSLTQASHEIDPDQNALHKIHQKCFEALDDMKLESILKMLCNVDITED